MGHLGAMQIVVSGKNIDIGDSLRQHAQERVSQIVDKYFTGTVSAHILVEKQKSQFECECTLHLTTGLTLKASGEAGDAYAAVDGALEHLEVRLRRYKRRLKDHHAQRSRPVRKHPAASFVIAASENEDVADGEDGLNPAVIAETVEDISELSVGEAVMQLDISTTSFIVFRNVRHGGINVVYRRQDGNIGWLDPQQDTAAAS